MIRVVVADDQALMRTALEHFVAQAEDLEVVGSAEDGVQALEAARTLAPDVVLMDMQMPVMDGATATREIRRLPGAAGRVPIIALTADAISNHRERYLEAGMDAYFTKPIDWKTLSEAISRLTNPTDTLEVSEAGELSKPMTAERGQDTEREDDLLIQLPLLDTARLDELRAAVGDSYDMMIGMFPESAREELDALRAALDAGDASTARRAWAIAQSMSRRSLSAGVEPSI